MSIVIAIGSFVFWFINIYVSNTEIVPSVGGTYTEGIIGQPLHINPIISQANDTDADLSQIIYSSLLKYDKDGMLINDLADNYSVSSDKKEYTFRLKQGIRWHSGELLTADDVVFTVNMIKNKNYNQLLKQNWQGVDIEKIDDYSLKFKLKKPYFGFVENLTIGIMPKHIWESISDEKFSLVKYNLEPIGSGPYKFVDYQKDSEGNILSYKLEAFPEYFSGRPNISKIVFNFYADENSLIDAYNRKEIIAAGDVSFSQNTLSKIRKGSSILDLSRPWSFAVFFNQTKSVALANDEVRLALVYATDRDEIIKNVFSGKAIPLKNSFFPNTDEYDSSIDYPNFDLEKAKTILSRNDWVEKDGLREKDGNKLEMKMLVLNRPELTQTAEILKEQWSKIGMRVEIETLDSSDLQQNYIQPREYQALLVGQATSFQSDIYSFWHSSQKNDPGLNWTLFSDERADKLIEESREEMDTNKRIEKYHKFQEIFNNENPALYLYSPFYLYLMDEKIKGVEINKINYSQHRFSNIADWYIKTKRTWK